MAFSSKTGLGYQTKAYCDNLKPTKVMGIDLSPYNLLEIDKSWYEDFNTTWVQGLPTLNDISEFIEDIDVFIITETPLNPKLFEICKQKGVKTVLIPNYEFLNANYTPDLLLIPSLWHEEDIKKLNIPYKFLPLPIQKINKVLKNGSNTFSHITGRIAQFDRNGAIEYLEAIKQMKGDYQYLFYYQTPLEPARIEQFIPIQNKLNEVKELLGDKLTIIVDCKDNMEMYSSAQVLVLPRKFGGQCMPMIEALSFGMPIIMTDISPNNKILPKEWLVKTQVNGFINTSYVLDLDVAIISDLIEKMVSVMNNIVEENTKAEAIAEKMLWSNLINEYLEVLEELCQKK